MKIELNEKELTELGETILDTDIEQEREDLGQIAVDKINEILSKQLVEIQYLKASQVKFNTKEKIDQISQDAVMRLMTMVLKRHLDRKPTEEDFKKVRFSHETGSDHNRFVYFPEGKYLGQYMNVKEGEWFKFVFRFK